jgi:hypothetical protein
MDLRHLNSTHCRVVLSSCALALLLTIPLPRQVNAQDGTSAIAGTEAVSPPRDQINPAMLKAGYPVFDKSSFWYQEIPKQVTLHEKSEQFAQEFARQVKTYFGHIGINVGNYSSPVYTVGPDVPTVTVTLWDCLRNGYHDQKLARDFAAVPIPSYAVPAGGTDSEMSIYQPSTDALWEFWAARKVGGGWQACWGGHMPGVSSNPGIWPSRYGAAATGLPFAPGQILAEELRQGEIRHVMGIAIVDAEETEYSWPANRTDGWNPNKEPNRIPEGLRLRLDPTVDLESLNLHPVAKAIAKAAQIYGFVVWDKGGSVALRAENPKRYTTVGLPDPYPALFDDTPSYKIMNRFPWDKMQFLPMDYGEPN